MKIELEVKEGEPIVPVAYTRLLRPEGFLEAFMEKCRTCVTYKVAYEKVEEEHEKWFGFRRYSEYGAFRKAKTIQHKKNITMLPKVTT